MNYKYLQCNKITTKEVLGIYLTKEGKIKVKENFKKKKQEAIARKFSKKTARNKYKVSRFKKNFKKPNKIKPVVLNKKFPTITTSIPLSKKAMNKKFGQLESVNSWFKPIDEGLKVAENSPDYGIHNKQKLFGKYKYYVGKQFISKKKWKYPYRAWKYHARALYWNNRRLFSIKFAKYSNFFNRELVLLNRNKKYVYNRTDYSIVSVNLTPNNVTIVVTGADGHILLWGTSGTRGFNGSSKHAYMAIQAVALSMYRRILGRKLKNIKLIYRGRRTKIRMRRVLSIFCQGERWKKYKILAVIDMSPLPHNGCKKPKKRR